MYLRDWVKLATIFLGMTFLSFNVFAKRASWSTIESNFKSAGGDLKALSHVRCFLSLYGKKEFSFRRPVSSSQDKRCYNIQSAQYTHPRYFTVIDYIKSGFERRLFLVDTQKGEVSAIGVAHGRYKSGYIRFFLRPYKNSLKYARYFANIPGSKAPSSGFYFAGQEYVGKFGRSMILHGLEPEINDKACERAIVIHKHSMVSKRRAYVMSSGCPMVTPSEINPLIDALKGKQDGLGLTEPGGLVFIYGPRERAWTYGHCPISK